MTGFAATLRTETASDWQAAITHRFVDEIFAGTLQDQHLRPYLVQDYQFCDAPTSLRHG